MFTCKRCHKREVEAGCPDFHPFRSLGTCEVCGKIGECVDCKFYKSRAVFPLLWGGGVRPRLKPTKRVPANGKLRRE